MIAGVLLGAVVGAILGLTGAGGGVLAVPMIMVAYGWTVPQAAPVGLIAVAAAAAVGAYTGWRLGLVRYRAAALMGVTGTLASPLGLWLGHYLPARVLDGLFAAVMVLVAGRMLRHTLRRQPLGELLDDDAAGEHLCALHPQTGRVLWTPRTGAVIAGIGAGTGVLSGLLGIGGGFVIVPGLIAATAMPLINAIGSSLVSVTAFGATTAASYAWSGLVDWPLAFMFVAGGAAGGLVGTRMARHLAGHKNALTRIFSGIVIVVGIYVITRSLLG
jgi:uncharacterized membrane protein YfcA